MFLLIIRFIYEFFFQTILFCNIVFYWRNKLSHWKNMFTATRQTFYLPTCLLVADSIR